MEAAAHTPTPWMAFVEDRRTFIGSEQPGTTPLLVAEVWNDADAAMILAAPAMLAALEAATGQYVAFVSNGRARLPESEREAFAAFHDPILDQMCAALALARGEVVRP